MLVSSHNSLLDFSILDPDVNFYHLPLIAIVKLPDCTENGNARVDSGKLNRPSEYPRWDKADGFAYYSENRVKLNPVLSELDNLLNTEVVDKSLICNSIDLVYESIVYILTDAENQFVPRHRKNSINFWWNEELNAFKQAAVESNQA